MEERESDIGSYSVPRENKLPEFRESGTDGPAVADLYRRLDSREQLYLGDILIAL